MVRGWGSSSAQPILLWDTIERTSGSGVCAFYGIYVSKAMIMIMISLEFKLRVNTFVLYFVTLIRKIGSSACDRLIIGSHWCKSSVKVDRDRT
jgi:hypothetical protein